jgi:hypothetical protein
MGQRDGHGDPLNGTPSEGQLGNYYLVMADRQVEEASRRVAEQIRVVSEINAAGGAPERATDLLQELQQQLKQLTERREAIRLEVLHGHQQDEREAG